MCTVCKFYLKNAIKGKRIKFLSFFTAWCLMPNRYPINICRKDSRKNKFTSNRPLLCSGTGQQ